MAPVHVMEKKLKDSLFARSRSAWIKGFICGVMAGVLIFYGLIQFWEVILP